MKMKNKKRVIESAAVLLLLAGSTFIAQASVKDNLRNAGLIALGNYHDTVITTFENASTHGKLNYSKTQLDSIDSSTNSVKSSMQGDLTLWMPGDNTSDELVLSVINDTSTRLEELRKSNDRMAAVIYNLYYGEYTVQFWQKTSSGSVQLCKQKINFTSQNDEIELIGTDVELTKANAASLGVSLDHAIVVPKYCKEFGTDHKVTKITDSLAQNSASITSVSLDDSTAEIGNQAFSGCTNLSSLEISDKLQIIGTEAFYKCKSLTNLYLPSDIKYLRDRAFSNCLRLKTVYYKEKFYSNATVLVADLTNNGVNVGTDVFKNTDLNGDSVTLSFNTAGGTAVDDIIAGDGDIVNLPAASKKTGYSFMGWKDATGTIYQAGGLYTALTSMQFTAQWSAKPVRYTLKYVSASGKVLGASETRTGYYDQAITPDLPVYEGYTKPTWSTSLKSDSPSQVITYTIEYPLTEYAVTVKFSNDIKDDVVVKYTIESIDIDFSDKVPDKIDISEFQGLYANSDYSGTNYTRKITSGSSGNKTLYAEYCSFQVTRGYGWDNTGGLDDFVKSASNRGLKNLVFTDQKLTDCTFVADVSSNSDGSVKCYYDDNTSTAYVTTEHHGHKVKAPESLQGAFLDCKFVKIDAENLDTSAVTTLDSAFFNCGELTDLRISSWNTSNVTSLECLFCNTAKLETVDFADWDVSAVKSFRCLFFRANNIKNIDVSKWNTTSGEDFELTFPCGSLKTIDVSDWNTSHAKTMRLMFWNATVDTLDVSKWDVSHVTNFEGTFEGCRNLKVLDVSNWNPVNAQSMSNLFDGCMSVTILDVSNWNISNCVSLQETFRSCVSITNLDVSNWDTSKCTSLVRTFNNCQKLVTLDTSNWDTSNCTSLNETFNNCISLTSINVSKWNTSNVTSMNSTFNKCQLLAALDVSNWDTSNVTSMKETFDQCYSLITVDPSSWNTAKVTNIDSIFKNCSSIQSLDLSNWDVSNVTTMSNAFNACNSLQVLNTSGWILSSCESLYSSFEGVSSLQDLNTSKWALKKIINLDHTFSGCSSLLSLDVSNWDTSNVTNMNSVFANCNALQTLDVSNWNTSNVTAMASLFMNCYKLSVIDVSKWDTGKATNIAQMFMGCRSVESLDVAHFDLSNNITLWGVFNDCVKLKSIDVKNWNTSNVFSMFQTFALCESLTDLDLSGWDTSNVTEDNRGGYGMAEMFMSCWSLKNIKFPSNFITSNTKNINGIFKACSGLETLDLSSWDTTGIQSCDAMFNDCYELKTIYVSDKFNVSNATSGPTLFYNCYNLKGQSGFSYSAYTCGKEYANYQTGYFTYKAA